jgi:VWFA-related protein
MDRSGRVVQTIVRVGIVCVLALVPLIGDEPQTSALQLVNLNVIAVDNRGQAVTDLTRDDFQVTDAGKPQKIVVFRHYDSKLGPAPSLAPDEISNRTGANIPRATVILLDLLNERLGARGYSSDQLERYLEKLESADYLYLYLLTNDGKLFVVHGLPGQGEPNPQTETPWTREIKPLLDNALREVTRIRPAGLDVAHREVVTFNALAALATDLTRVPGRKNVVWVTTGLPIALSARTSDTGQAVDFTPQVRKLSDALDRFGISIYPVREVLLDVPDAADMLAGLTGGRPDAGKDVGGAIQQAMNDARTSYLIGYYPPERNWDNKFHKLRVTCMRKGVRLDAKTGYYALPEPPAERAEEAVRNAAATQFDAAEIGLHAALSPDPNDRRKSHLEAHIDANDVVWTGEGNQYTGALRLAVVRYSASAQPEISTIVPLDLHQDEQQLDQARKQGIPYSEDLALPENVKAVRLIVFDSGSNAVGSVSIPVQAAATPGR